MKVELILECAKKAFPQFSWKIFPGSDTTVFDGRGGSFTLDLRCQMALQIALEREGWVFSCENDEFIATKEIRTPVKVGDMDGEAVSIIDKYDNTKPSLLMAIVREGMGE